MNHNESLSHLRRAKKMHANFVAAMTDAGHAADADIDAAIVATEEAIVKAAAEKARAAVVATAQAEVDAMQARLTAAQAKVEAAQNVVIDVPIASLNADAKV